MTTTTPGIWLTDPTAYRKKLSDFLASRDPLTVLADTPDVIDEIVGAHSAEVLRSRPYDGLTPVVQLPYHATCCAETRPDVRAEEP